MKPKIIKDAALFLQGTGLLFEINRSVLHKYGYALSVVVDEEGKVTGFGPVYETEDEAGFVFEDHVIGIGEAQVESFEKGIKYEEKKMNRIDKYGFEIQK